MGCWQTSGRIAFSRYPSKPDTAAREARDVITRDKVSAVIGTWSSAEALAVEEIINEHKVLHFAANSNSSRLTHENFSPWFFQYSPDTRMESGALSSLRKWQRRTTGSPSSASVKIMSGPEPSRPAFLRHSASLLSGSEVDQGVLVQDR